MCLWIGSLKGQHKSMLLQKWSFLLFLRIIDLTTVCKFILTLEPNSGTLLAPFNSSITSAGQRPISARLYTFLQRSCNSLNSCSIATGLVRDISGIIPLRSSVNHRPLEVATLCVGLSWDCCKWAIPHPPFVQEAGRRCRLVWIDPGTLMGTKDWALIPISSVIPPLSTCEVTQLAAFCLHAFCSRATAERRET